MAVDLPEAGYGARIVSLDDATSRRNTEKILLHAALHPIAVLISSHRLTIQPPYSATRCCPQMFGSSVTAL